MSFVLFCTAAVLFVPVLFGAVLLCCLWWCCCVDVILAARCCRSVFLHGLDGPQFSFLFGGST